jgi:hypothetical protein
VAKTKKPKTVVLGERTLRVPCISTQLYMVHVAEGHLKLYFNPAPDLLVEAYFTSIAGVFEGTGPTLKKAMDALNKDMLKTVHVIGALMGYEFEE